MEHFRVLPTDERYLGLSDDQVSLLFNNWLSTPPEDNLKRLYWERMEKKEKSLPDRDDLSEIGYAPEEVEAIMAELKRGK